METYNDELAQEIQRRGNKIKVHVGTEILDGEISILHSESPKIHFFLPCGGRFIEISERFTRGHILGALQVGFLDWNWLTCENNPLDNSSVGIFWPYPQHGGRK